MEPKTIVNEIIELENNGYKEVTLLGQNVDSYLWTELDFTNQFSRHLVFLLIIIMKTIVEK